MVLEFGLFRIQKYFKTIKNVIGRMEKGPPNFLTILFGVIPPPVRCYPVLWFSLFTKLQIDKDKVNLDG